MFRGFGFRVLGFGFRVSGFGFRVSGPGFRVSGFGFRVPDRVVDEVVEALHHPLPLLDPINVPGFGFQFSVSVSGFRVSSFRYQFFGGGFGFRASGFRFRVPGITFRVRGSGFSGSTYPKCPRSSGPSPGFQDSTATAASEYPATNTCLRPGSGFRE